MIGVQCRSVKHNQVKGLPTNLKCWTRRKRQWGRCPWLPTKCGMNRRSFFVQKSTFWAANHIILSNVVHFLVPQKTENNENQRQPSTKTSYSQVCDPSAQWLPYCVKAVEWTQYSLRQREQQSIGLRRHNEYPLRTKLSQKWVAPRKSILARELSWTTGALTTMMCKICQVFLFAEKKAFQLPTDAASAPQQQGPFQTWSNGDPWSKAVYPRS